LPNKKIKKKQAGEIKPENKYLLWFMLASFLVCVFLASSFKTGGDDDFFWHLATGRFIAENNYVPDTDVFGYVTLGSRWIPFEWGWDLLSYKLYTIGSYEAVLVFRSIILTITFLLYFLLLRIFGLNSVLIIILLFVLLAGSFDRLTPRPHIITYLFIVVLFYLLFTYKYIDRQKYYRRLFLLPLVFLVWCNFHMGVVIGIVILLIFLLTELIIYFYPSYFSKFGNKPLSKIHLKNLLVISGLSLLVLLINPHGFQTYVYAYEHSNMQLLQVIHEWQNPFTGKIDENFIVIIYKILLFAGLILLYYAVKKRELVFALSYIVFALYSIRAIRFTVDYEIVIVFFLALAVQELFFDSLSGNVTFSKVMNSNILKLLLIVFFVYLSVVIHNNKIYHTIKIYRDSGYGLDENQLPVQLVSFMKGNNIGGTPFNKFETGGYLVWNFPGQKNFIDSRNLNDNIFNEYYNIYGMKQGFERKIDNYKIDYIIYFDPELFLKSNNMKVNLNGYLFINENWKLVFWDDKSILFLRNITKFYDVINKYEYTVLRPYDMYFNKAGFEAKIKNNPVTARKELERKAGTEPNGFFYRNMDALVSKYLNTN
jgi:hypothetical protein